MIQIYRKIMVVAIIGLFFGAGVIPSIAENNTETYDTDWWPMYHHDLQNSGYSTSIGPETNNVKWSYTLDGKVGSSPAVWEGKVYVGSEEDSYYHDRGRLYCFDADGGVELWNFFIGYGVESSPAIYEGKVYFGSNDNKVYCLDAVTGDEIWSCTTGSAVLSSPAVYNDKIYIGSYDGRFYCFDAEGGSEIWSYMVEGEYEIKSSPAIYNENVYFGANNGKLYCLDGDTGAEIWSVQTKYYLTSSPTICNGKIFVGGYLENEGEFYCLDVDNGDVIWSYPTEKGIGWCTPAVWDGKVYMGSCYGRFYCLNIDDGAKIWSYLLGGEIYSSPAVVAGKVYVSAYDGTIHCFDAISGSQIWHYDTGYPAWSSPSIANGRVYVGSDSWELYCFADSTSPNKPSISGPKKGGVNEEIEYVFNAVDPDGDDVKYTIDWGDGDTQVTDFYSSGDEVKIKHSWTDKGAYTIKAKAIDSTGLTSPEGSLVVTMPKKKSFSMVSVFEQIINHYLSLFRLLL